MKINVTIDVPDGEFCEGCDLWYRAEDKKCYCLLFGMKELKQRFKENMVQGANIVKCFECQTSRVHDLTIEEAKPDIDLDADDVEIFKSMVRNDV